MSRTGSLLVLVLALPALAQTPTQLEQLGAVIRSQPDFYGAIAGSGETVRVEWKLTTPTVELGASDRLTLTVRNAVNPLELTQPDLSKLPAFTSRFSVIESLPGTKPADDAKAVEFIYSLRPREEGSIEIVPPRYRYFSPRAPKGRELQTAFVEPLTLKVTKPVVKVAPAVPLTAPESFFELADESRFSRSHVPMGYWLTLMLGAPLLVCLWVFGWRVLFPDASRLARLRRNRIVRRTLDHLRLAPKRTDPAGETARALRAYFSARFGISPAATTPVEISEGLQALQLPAELIAESEAILRSCDAERFGNTVSPSSAPGAAIRLVETWEGRTA